MKNNTQVSGPVGFKKDLMGERRLVLLMGNQRLPQEYINRVFRALEDNSLAPLVDSAGSPLL